MMDGLALPELVQAIRLSRGLAHKCDIDRVVSALGIGHGENGAAAHDAIRVGDDCAAIPFGDGYLLLAIEGFLNEFVASEPWFAGYCGVMVNLSDIAAMGGRPIAIVDALWSFGAEAAGPVLAGLRAGAFAYGVPIVGGHTNMRSDRGQLAVAVLGQARKLLTSFDAKPGDALIIAIDLRGRYREPHPYWDASTGSPPERLRGDLAILAGIAEDGLAQACKDISMAGVVGTALMLLEGSGLGGVIDTSCVPLPDGVALQRWLLSFPSFGFVLSVAPPHIETVLSRFRARGIEAAQVGGTDASGKVRLSDGESEAVIWDFGVSALTGCNGKAAKELSL